MARYVEDEYEYEDERPRKNPLPEVREAARNLQEAREVRRSLRGKGTVPRSLPEAKEAARSPQARNSRQRNSAEGLLFLSWRLSSCS